ncbi:MAG: DNA repair exonuclease [Chloroflexi bacterium]|nr:DNA repair exonuclease [Chloroflexota bacterium]
MRILHFSDLHLDKRFPGLPHEVSVQRRKDLRQRLKDLLGQARTRAVDAVTIGGDLYEDETARVDLGVFLADLFNSIAPTPIVISPGNHDPWTPRSVYATTTWPANVHIFDSAAWSERRIGDLSIYGTAFISNKRTENPFASAPTPRGPSIVLIHGTVDPPDPYCLYAPFTSQDIASRGFLLALLGHIHTPSSGLVGGRIAWTYPGSPEALDFSETGPRRALLVSCQDTQVDIQTVPLTGRQIFKESIEVEGVVTSQRIIDELRKRQVPHPEWTTGLLRVVLRGNATVPSVIDDLRSAGIAWHIEVEDGTEPEWPYESLSKEQTVAGEFTRLMLSRLKREDGDQAVLRRALHLGLRALHNQELDD